MIVGSLLLILVAVTLLVFGLAGGSSALLIASIVASLFAAVALVIGARQAAARAVAADDPLLDPRADLGAGPGLRRSTPDVSGVHAADQTGPADGRSTVAPPQRTDDLTTRRDGADVTVGERPDSTDPRSAPPSSPADADLGGPTDLDDPDEDDPADEPAPQRVSPADAAQLARSTVEVLVVDGRPRYHLIGCPHLAGRDPEAVPVAEAIELGFTPCGRCRPVDRLVVATHPG